MQSLKCKSKSDRIGHILLLGVLMSSLLWYSHVCPVYAQVPAFQPAVRNPDFIVEQFITNLSQPTSVAFVNDNSDDLTLLILQKNDGTVRVARNGVLDDRPALDVHVANEGEQGMLGIAISGNSSVYLYFTESSRDGGEAISKRVYQYFWNGQELVEPVLVKDLPATRAYHNGGAMVSDQDGTIYLLVGDTGRYGILQNKKGGELYPDTSVILPVAPSGDYYAIGIRNGFGMAFDPVTDKIWITENGDDDFDEINLVERGFNSGWDVIMGPATSDEQLSNLVDYGNYEYADPKFSWQRTVAPAGMTFIDSGAMSMYRDSLFVGGCNNGILYKLTLNEQRDQFVFSDPALADNVANTNDSTDEIIFGERFGCITDLNVGPDGLLYITTYSPFISSAIYRLVPKITLPGVASIEIVDQITIYAILAIAGTGMAGGIVLFRKLGRKKPSQNQAF